MIENSNYIEVGFKNTVSEEFPQKAQSLTAEFDKIRLPRECSFPMTVKVQNECCDRSIG